MTFQDLQNRVNMAFASAVRVGPLGDCSVEDVTTIRKFVNAEFDHAQRVAEFIPIQRPGPESPE
jgi:hypothetical protein